MFTKTQKNFITLAVTLFLVAVFCILFSVSVTAPFSFAETEKSNENLNVDYMTGNYYNFGEIVAISSSANGFSLLEIIDESLYLRIIQSNDLIKLENTSYENFEKTEVVAFSDRIFVKQDDGIYVFVIGESQQLEKYLDLTFSYTILDEPFIGDYKSFGGAITDEVLIVDYTSIIVFFDISLSIDSTVEEKTINPIQVTSINSFDRMVVENNEETKINLHLYDSKTGNKFTRYCEKKDNGRYSAEPEKTQNGLEVFENKDLYSYFNGGISLRSDGLYQGETKVVEIAPEDETSIFSDAVIKTFSRMCAHGNKLYVVDNGQKAVKVFDGEYNLVELYGAEGAGTSDNQNGLTRFRNPKYLTASNECLALFDEGNKRIVLLDLDGNVKNFVDAENVLGLAILDGIWFATPNKVVKLDYEMNVEIEITSSNLLVSLVTDKTNIFVNSTKGLYKVKGAKLELIEDLSVGQIYGGKHDGVLYSVNNGSFSMLKDGKEIISAGLGEHSFFAVDYQGNVIYGKDNKLTLMTRKLDGFDVSSYETELPIHDLVITNLGSVFALSDSALVKVDFHAVSSETTFEKPEKTYPFKSIKVEDMILGYTRPDNYESVVEIGESSFILFATIEYQGNTFYFTELLRDGKYVELYIPEMNATISENIIEEEQYVKYGGTDAFPCAYAYPSNSAPAVLNISKETSYKVTRLISADWNWYELLIDGKICYVNALNYITAEPPFITVERYYMRAKADSLGKMISLYASPDANSEVVGSVGEGFVLELTEPYTKDKEFLQVRYNNKIAYVKTVNVQKDGLTEGQKFALCFAGVVVGITAIFGILSLIVRRRKTE